MSSSTLFRSLECDALLSTCSQEPPTPDPLPQGRGESGNRPPDQLIQELLARRPSVALQIHAPADEHYALIFEVFALPRIGRAALWKGNPAARVDHPEPGQISCRCLFQHGADQPRPPRQASHVRHVAVRADPAFGNSLDGGDDPGRVAFRRNGGAAPGGTFLTRRRRATGRLGVPGRPRAPGRLRDLGRA